MAQLDLLEGMTEQRGVESNPGSEPGDLELKISQSPSPGHVMQAGVT